MKRVAVVGTGVSGLVAARELHRAGADVTVFEADGRVGGHSNTVTVESEDGRWDVDTGFIVLNDRNYPHFQALLEELGVDTQPAPMSFSVADGHGDFEWSTRPLGLFAKGSHLFDPRFHRMLSDLARFNREARALIGSDRSVSLRAFCEDRGFSEYFVERLILPQAAAVWSADPAQLDSFPAGFFAEFMDHHCALQVRGRPLWRSVTGGSRSYVNALTRPFRHRIRQGCPVHEVRRRLDRVELRTPAGTESYDEVVLAVHSDQALEMLADPSLSEREVLGAIPYQSNEVVLHTDERLLPRRRRAWASWNFHLPADQSQAAGGATVTYNMNILQRLSAPQQFLVTLNRPDAIAPEKVIRRFAYSHPVYTDAAVRAQARWAEVSGRRRTHYCGAYWGWGFHEDGVRSGLRAARSIAPAASPTPVPLAAPKALAA